jgi:hypothetical protein
MSRHQDKPLLPRPYSVTFNVSLCSRLFNDAVSNSGYIVSRFEPDTSRIKSQKCYHLSERADNPLQQIRNVILSSVTDVNCVIMRLSFSCTCFWLSHFTAKRIFRILRKCLSNILNTINPALKISNIKFNCDLFLNKILVLYMV